MYIMLNYVPWTIRQIRREPEGSCPFGWLFDVLENVNHFRMAGTYPNLSPFSLRFGPLFTLMKWVFALAPLVVALLGFALRLK